MSNEIKAKILSQQTTELGVFVKCQVDFIHDSQRLIKWVEVKNQKPKTNEKYSESEDVLCMDSNGIIFVAWYNSKLDQWLVSHFHASNKALSLDNVPVLWADISSLKNSRV